jgi:hypothetical protein
LIEQFRNRFASLLEAECEPIRASVKSDYEITMADLNRRDFKDKFADKIRRDFDALLDRLSRANNIYEAIAMQTESDRMKQRFIESFMDEQARIDAAKGRELGEPPRPYHRTKTLSAKSLFSGKNKVANKQDIDRLLDDVRVKLEAQLEEDTTIHIV